MRNLIPEPRYCTYYVLPDGSGVQQKFATKEQNDLFAEGLLLMGTKKENVVKSEYNPHMRQWNRYHNKHPEEIKS